MKQEYKSNTKFEILTPHGWEDFDGVIRNDVVKEAVVITTSLTSVCGTLDHRFYSKGQEKLAGSFIIGDTIDTVFGELVVENIEHCTLDITYEIFNTETHTILANSTHSHQCDEFAFVPPNKSSEFWTSITPVLSTGGSCIITSTPKNDEDQFAQIWKGAIDNTDEYGNVNPDGLGKNKFFAVSVPWWEHPERDEKWAEPFRESLGEAKFRQEFCNEFISSDETLINPLTLTRLKGITPIYYLNAMRWFKEPEPNKTYLVALDPSLGTGGDAGAIQVFQLPEMIQVAEWQHNHTAPRGQVRVMMQALVYLDSILREHPDQHGDPDLFWTVENNSIGEAILQIIEDTGEERFPGHFVNEKKRKGQTRRFRKGMNTTNKNKLSACARLKSLIESGRMTINSGNLVKELKNFVAKENSFSAKPGEHDDLVSALILVVRMLDVAIGWSGNAGDLREYIDDDELSDSEAMPIAF